MNRTRLSQWIYVGLMLMLTACQAAGQPLSAAMFRPGDTINGLSLGTGAADAPPLWSYCSPSQENTLIRTFHCRVPAWQTLAIGNLFLLLDAGRSNLGGSELAWELSIDDHVVDLQSYGTFDYVMPGMAMGPSPVREVFLRVTDWNLVMTNLNPGEHTLRFLAQNETESYAWFVNLVIEAADEVDISVVPFPQKA